MNCIKIYGVLLLCFITAIDAHKMVILVSPPRSLSTVFLRMMAARGDFAVFNEPGLATFHKLYSQESSSVTSFREDTLTFEHVQNRLKEAKKQGNIFIKEMFFAAQEYLLDDAFITSSDCYVVFLVRNPHHVALSNFKKLCVATGSQEKVWEIKRKFPELLNYGAFYAQYQRVQERGVNKPYVIIAEELVAQPRAVLTELFLHLDIPMTEKCLSWEALDKDFSCQDMWNDSKTDTASALWHDHALSSSSFSVLPIYKTDSNGHPTFEEITDQELRGAHRWEYYCNAVYYDKFIIAARS